MMFATGVLESTYRKDMSINDGVKLAFTAVHTAIQRDIATGNGIDIFTITKDGVKLVLEKEISTRVTM
jgi:proteasome beta subunit